MYFSIPSYAEKILTALKAAGFEAYLVGGCVRDLLLNKVPHDYDIATSATAEEIKSIFKKTADTGIKHGTVTVIIGKKAVEVTTFRTDGEYKNHRKPESVNFVKNLDQDLLRRDFTVNAMAYSSEKGLIDLFGGVNDLKHKVLRTVGNPADRFSEDALRILRLFRFASQLNFQIEDNTFNEAIIKAFELKEISRERIADELSKLILSDYPEKISEFINKGGMEFLGIRKYSENYRISSLPKKLKIRFFAFCENAGTNACNLAKSLKMSNEIKAYTEKIVLTKGVDETSDYEVKKALRLYSSEILSDRFILDRKDNSLILKTIQNGEPYRISDLAINGNDIIYSDFSGEKVGEILDTLLDKVIKGELQNTKEELLKFIKQ